MNLARNKNGRIGRQIPGQGLQAKTVPTFGAEPYGNLYLSERSINQEQANRSNKEKRQAQALQNHKIAEAGKRQAQRKQRAQENRQIGASRQAVNFNPMNAKLANHYAKQKTMGQDEMVATSLYHQPSWSRGTSGSVLTPRPSADFSNSGANMDLVPSGAPVEPVVWHTDFRTHMIKGNPLTRNGSYGPGVTDFDRFVNGRDVNDQAIDGGGDGTERIAGGTMLGRLNGSQVNAGIIRRGRDNNLGDFWDSVSSWGSDLLDSAQGTITDQLPGILLDQVTGSGSTPTGGGGTVTVIRPTTGTTTTMVPGVPNWALYSGLGLMGVGVLFALINAVKK